MARIKPTPQPTVLVDLAFTSPTTHSPPFQIFKSPDPLQGINTLASQILSSVLQRYQTTGRVKGGKIQAKQTPPDLAIQILSSWKITAYKKDLFLLAIQIILTSLAINLKHGQH